MKKTGVSPVRRRGGPERVPARKGALGAIRGGARHQQRRARQPQPRPRRPPRPCTAPGAPHTHARSSTLPAHRARARGGWQCGRGRRGLRNGRGVTDAARRTEAWKQEARGGRCHRQLPEAPAAAQGLAVCRGGCVLGVSAKLVLVGSCCAGGAAEGGRASQCLEAVCTRHAVRATCSITRWLLTVASHLLTEAYRRGLFDLDISQACREVVDKNAAAVLDEIEAAIIHVALSILQGEGFSYSIPSRTKGNQLYVPELDRIVLKDSTSSRPFANTATCRKAVITTRILGLVHELCKKQIHVTKRDLFYTDVKLFEVNPASSSPNILPEQQNKTVLLRRNKVTPCQWQLHAMQDQGNSDSVLDDVACMLGCTRSSLHGESNLLA